MKLEIELEKQVAGFKLELALSLEGGHFGLFGPSGSGKTTITNLLSGLQKPDRGIIRLNDKILFSSAAKINLPPEKRRIGIVFQGAHLFPHLNVEKNLLYGWNRAPADRKQPDFSKLVQTLELHDLLGRNVNNLSGGEKQRVAIGRTILSNPELIILDEPLTGLDLKLKTRIMDYLKQVLEEFNIPYIFISHSLKEMRMMTEKTILIEKGNLAGVRDTEKLAREFLGRERGGYLNLITLPAPEPYGDLWKYKWGTTELILSEKGSVSGSVFELGSTDITLFKDRPAATSARNIIECTVTEIFEAGNRVGVVLYVDGKTLITQIVNESVQDLGIRVGGRITAIIKATAFHLA